MVWVFITCGKIITRKVRPDACHICLTLLQSYPSPSVPGLERNDLFLTQLCPFCPPCHPPVLRFLPVLRHILHARIYFLRFLHVLHFFHIHSFKPSSRSNISFVSSCYSSSVLRFLLLCNLRGPNLYSSWRPSQPYIWGTSPRPRLVFCSLLLILFEVLPHIVP